MAAPRPPAAPSAGLDRPALAARVAAGLRRGVCVVIAAPGFGKSAVLAASGALPGVVVIDDADAMPAHALTALLRRHRRSPVLLAARTDLDDALLDVTLEGRLTRLGADVLAFSEAEIAALLPRWDADPGRAPELLRRTGGWPALTRLAAMDEEDAAARYVARAVDCEPPSIRALLRDVAELGEADEALCGAAGHTLAHALPALARRGLLERTERGFRPAPALRIWPPWERRDAAGRGSLLRRAVAGHVAAGRPLDAVETALRAGDRDLAARTLETEGPALADEEPGRILRLTASPVIAPTPDLALLAADAAAALSDAETALAACARAEHLGAAPAAVSWRRGRIHYLNGEHRAALEALDDADGTATDGALARAWRATVHWVLGERDAAHDDAAVALSLARAAGDARAQAAAWTARALVAALDGDRTANEAAYAHALRHAERARDALQMIRIRTNRGSRHLEEGAYAEAIKELDAALSAGAPGTYAILRGLAHSNRGEAAFRLGRLAEARSDLLTARELLGSTGSLLVANVLCVLGDVQLARGERTRARGTFEEALGIAEAHDDRQVLLPALCGLATALLPREPATAAPLVERALREPPGITHARVLLTAAAHARCVGRKEAAEQHARAALSVARRRRDTPAMVDALLALAEDAEDREVLVAEALSIATDLGDEHAIQRVRDWRPDGGPASAGVVVETLGGFRVRRGGREVTTADWGSRKPRDLLKLLACRRGQPVARDELMEVLWPGGDPSRLAGRLSVALSTLRARLDPERRLPPDRYVRADRASIALDLRHVELDFVAFEAAAAAGLGPPEDVASLRRAEALWRGAFLEEDRYEDWAAPVREELRAVRAAVLRRLAAAEVAAGEHERAAAWQLRLLEDDPLDESAHRALVAALAAAGRHGEARRRHELYARQMASIGRRPSPLPAAVQ